MQAGQLTIANPNVAYIGASSMSARIGKWVGKVFGCWHMEMSRPFSQQGQAYKVCLSCGAQRQFDLRNWEMQGDFYYHLPTSNHFHQFHGLAAVKRTTN